MGFAVGEDGFDGGFDAVVDPAVEGLAEWGEDFRARGGEVDLAVGVGFEVEESEVAVAGGGGGADDFPVAGGEAALFGGDDLVVVFAFEDELVVEGGVDEGEFVHGGEFGSLGAGDLELDEGESGFAVEWAGGWGFGLVEPFGEAEALPVGGFGNAGEIGEGGDEVDEADGFGDDAGRGAGLVDDHGDVIGLESAAEGEAVAEGDAGFVEVVSVIGGDDDDGVFVESGCC